MLATKQNFTAVAQVTKRGVVTGNSRHFVKFCFAFLFKVITFWANKCSCQLQNKAPKLTTATIVLFLFRRVTSGLNGQRMLLTVYLLARENDLVLLPLLQLLLFLYNRYSFQCFCFYCLFLIQINLHQEPHFIQLNFVAADAIADGFLRALQRTQHCLLHIRKAIWHDNGCCMN